MIKEKNYIELIENLNREYFALINSKQYLDGRKLQNLRKALRQGKIFRLFLTWIRSICQTKSTIVSAPCLYNYGEYPDRNMKFCVYTCITGGYDTLQNVHIHPSNVDFIAYTDDTNISSNGWVIKPLPPEVLKIKGNADRNRYMKMHPSLVGDYDYVMYVDGLVEIYSDITNMINVMNTEYGLAIHKHFYRDCIYDEVEFCKSRNYGNLSKMEKLLSLYRDEGFPKHYGLLECTVILSDMHNKESAIILDDWWKEHVKQNSGRDQLTLPFVLWSKKIKIEDIGTLGNNVKTNPKFRINGHSDKYAYKGFTI